MSSSLSSELQSATLVICDNFATQHNKEAAEALIDIGCWFLSSTGNEILGRIHLTYAP